MHISITQPAFLALDNSTTDFQKYLQSSLLLVDWDKLKFPGTIKGLMMHNSVWGSMWLHVPNVWLLN